MTRGLRLLGAVLLALLASPAVAGPLDTARIAAIDKAADGFLAMGREAYRTGQPPRQSDPAAKALLDVVFDLNPIKGSPIPFAEIDKLNDWTARVAAVGSVYLFAGTGIPDQARLQTHPPDEKQLQQIERNTVAFAPEVGRYIDSQLQLEQVLIETVMAEIAARPAGYNTPQAEAGLAKVRGGLKQTVNGALVTLLTSELDVAWVRSRLPALQAVAPVAAKFLLPADRAELRDTAKEVAGQFQDPAIKAGLDNFIQAMGG